MFPEYHCLSSVKTGTLLIFVSVAEGRVWVIWQKGIFSLHSYRLPYFHFQSSSLSLRLPAVYSASFSLLVLCVGSLEIMELQYGYQNFPSESIWEAKRLLLLSSTHLSLLASLCLALSLCLFLFPLFHSAVPPTFPRFPHMWTSLQAAVFMSACRGAAGSWSNDISRRDLWAHFPPESFLANSLCDRVTELWL